MTQVGPGMLNMLLRQQPQQASPGHGRNTKIIGAGKKKLGSHRADPNLGDMGEREDRLITSCTQMTSIPVVETYDNDVFEDNARSSWR